MLVGLSMLRKSDLSRTSIFRASRFRQQENLDASRMALSFLLLLFPIVASSTGLRVVAPAVASADEDEALGLHAAYIDCLEGGGSTTEALLHCTHDEFAFQDRRLNVVYKKLMTGLSSDERDRLRNEERKWVSDKESRCALKADAGTTDQVGASDCFVRETARRAAELEKRLLK